MSLIKFSKSPKCTQCVQCQAMKSYFARSQQRFCELALHFVLYIVKKQRERERERKWKISFLCIGCCWSSFACRTPRGCQKDFCLRIRERSKYALIFVKQVFKTVGIFLSSCKREKRGLGTHKEQGNKYHNS